MWPWWKGEGNGGHVCTSVEVETAPSSPGGAGVCDLTAPCPRQCTDGPGMSLGVLISPLDMQR